MFKSKVLKNNPKVIISVGGRFHAFNLAFELQKKGALRKLITSYPKNKALTFGISKENVESIIIKEVLERGYNRLPVFLKNKFNPQFFISEVFDRLVAKKIEALKDFNIFIGFSSKSLNSLRVAKKLGKITILERGSSHIKYQSELLKEEYERFSVKAKLTHPKIVEKELKEYQLTDYISIPSSFVEKSFLEYGVPKERLIRNPYGVDTEEFRQAPKEDNVFRVIFVGGMILRKGVHYLLQAFAELNLPNSELLLVGALSDEIKPFFKKYEGKFRWVGHKPQKELYKYYSQSSVFVLPSIEDGFGMVILQAAACGLPIIASENTGGPDFVEEGKEGFIVPIRDVEALKEKILFFYKNPEIAYQMGQNARKKVEENFTWQKYGERMIEIYREVLKKAK